MVIAAKTGNATPVLGLCGLTSRTAIVKLQMRYERQTGDDEGWYMGTGWLIAPDLMVTAGHNVYNWSGGDGVNGLGKAVTIKCHIGYQGKASVGKEGVQSRLAQYCATTAEWLGSSANRNRDFAFIKVDKPFTGDLRLFSFVNTPMTGNDMIGVVGYPGDKSITDSAGREDRGALMYKEFKVTAYNRSTTERGMLTYRISTFGGQSGAPVLFEGTQTGIATHVYGLGDKNQASPIVDYHNFVAAFSKKFQRVGSVDGIDLHKPLAALTESALEGGEEGFLDVLKSIGSVAAKVGQVVVPTISTALLGPAGAPIGAIGGAALGFLGKVCSESLADGSVSPPEGIVSKAPALLGSGELQRGVLAEATLQGLQRLRRVDPYHPTLAKIDEEAQKTYDTIVPCIHKLAPHFKQGLIHTAAVVGCGTDYVVKNDTPIVTSNKRIEIGGRRPESASEEIDVFGESLLAATKPVCGEEAFFEKVGDFFSKALEVAKPTLRAAGIAALNNVANRLGATGTTESAADSAGGSGSDIEAVKLVLKRAAAAESVLQAVGKLSRQELVSLNVPSGGCESAGEESFIDFVKSAAQTIGSVVMKAAPVVVNNVLPAVLKAVAGGQESAPEAGPSPPSPLRRKSSRFQFDSEHSGNNLNGIAVGTLVLKDGVLELVEEDKSRPQNPHLPHPRNDDLPPYDPCH